jgi:hypothetical protein
LPTDISEASKGGQAGLAPLCPRACSPRKAGILPGGATVARSPDKSFGFITFYKTEQAKNETPLLHFLFFEILKLLPAPNDYLAIWRRSKIIGFSIFS